MLIPQNKIKGKPWAVPPKPCRAGRLRRIDLSDPGLQEKSGSLPSHFWKKALPHHDAGPDGVPVPCGVLRAW